MLRKYAERLVLLALLCAPAHAFAWGVLAHRAVARIAENHLTPRARRAVARLLGTETLPLVSVWPDEILADPQYHATGPWHYVNSPTGLDFSAFVSQLTATPAVPSNAYNTLLRLRQDLKDPQKTDAEKVVALKFLVHLVGDAHQPLHAGHGEDRGSNDIKVSWRGHDTNLHSIWDTGLVEYPGLSYLEMATVYDHATPAQIKQWQRDDVGTWLFESYQLCTPIYAAAAANSKFDWHFYPTFGPTAERRILQAGIRLAGVLNELFG